MKQPNFAFISGLLLILALVALLAISPPGSRDPLSTPWLTPEIFTQQPTPTELNGWWRTAATPTPNPKP